MARLPKRPKAPKTKNPEVYKQYIQRLKDWRKRCDDIKKRPAELRKLKDQARNIR
jgi:hypothetical protein